VLGEGSRLAHLLTGAETRCQAVVALSLRQNVKHKGRSSFVDICLQYGLYDQAYTEAQMVMGMDVEGPFKPLVKLMGRANGRKNTLKSPMG
jgi:hypothetical protein